MKPISSFLTKIITFTFLAYLCQGCPIGGCSLPHSMLETSESFVLGYRDNISHLALKGTTYKHHVPTLEICESVFENYIHLDDWGSVGSRDSFAINLELRSNAGPDIEYERSFNQKKLLKNQSQAYADVNFNRIVSGFTIMKGAKNGRIVISESLKAINVFANTDYAHYKSGDLVNDAFELAYTDPLSVAQKHATFEPNHSGGDYIFVPFSGAECDIQGEKTRFDKDKNMYKCSKPAPFQWYDGEYFPTVQYQTLSDVNFAEIPHLSAMVALIPKVFPSIPGDYSFTIEVQFTNGMILRTNTPLIGFSGQ